MILDDTNKSFYVLLIFAPANISFELNLIIVLTMRKTYRKDVLAAN